MPAGGRGLWAMGVHGRRRGPLWVQGGWPGPEGGRVGLVRPLTPNSTGVLSQWAWVQPGSWLSSSGIPW